MLSLIRDCAYTPSSRPGRTSIQKSGSSNISPPVGSARDDITLSAQAAVQPLGTPAGYLRSTSLTGLVGSVRELACLQPPRGPRSGVAAIRRRRGHWRSAHRIPPSKASDAYEDHDETEPGLPCLRLRSTGWELWRW